MNRLYKELIRGFNSEQDEIQSFRSGVQDYFGCDRVVPVTNGTHAIELALLASGLKRGDGVIIPDISFIATATAVANCGMIPVYADIDENYFGLTLESLKSAFRTEVKAIIVVHFAGFVNREMDLIINFCRENDLILIEDCAQSYSGSFKGKKAGTLGDFGTFSFQSSKIINSGEGGMVLANNPEIGWRCQALADWGMSPEHPKRLLNLPSSNYRLSALQCYFLTHQLRETDSILKRRSNLVQAIIKACPDYGLIPVLPEERDDIEDCPFFLPIRTTYRVHMVEPREECPMNRSSIVPAILEFFFPDLLEKYREWNSPKKFQNSLSSKVVEELNFINLSQAEGLTPDQVLSVYR